MSARALAVSALLTPLLLLACATSQPAARRALPNVVVIYADDMGWGDLAAQWPESRIPTPHLDRLAAEGMRFNDAHSSSGICTPSRYALHTGRYHWRSFHGIVNSFEASVFVEEDVTLPELMRSAGYRTACIGKWHLGWDWAALRREDAAAHEGPPLAADFDWSRPVPDGPLAHGYDHYFGDDVPNFPPYAWIEDDRVVQAPSVPYAPDPQPAEGHHEGRPGPMLEGWRLDAVMPELTRRAVDWIAAQQDAEQPFFLYLPWTGPHAPIVPSEAFAGTTDVGGYGDFLAQCDDSAGQVLAALERHGLADDTVVIFTSDNGPEHYAYPRARDLEHRSMGPLRGLKRDVWEGGHRVPFVVRWPGVVEPGAVNDALVHQVDVMATLADVVGVSLAPGVAPDGRSLLPLWRGDPDAGPARRSHVINTFAQRWGLRLDDWVFLEADSGAHTKVPAWWDEDLPPGEAPLLYRLSSDPGQRVDVSGEHPELVAEARRLLAAIRAGDPGP
jgi:arylsulfatase A